MKEKGATILISTHMIDSIDGVWDQTLIMKAGKIVANVRRDEVVENNQSLEDLFFALTEGEEA